MKAQFIDGLKLIRDGIDLILAEDSNISNAPQKAEKEVSEKENVVAPNNTEVSEKATTANFSREQLDSMTYNDLKKLAKEIGVSAVGARPEITARILGEEVEIEKEEIDTSDAPEEEVTGDEIADQVREAVKEMSVSDIANILSEVGVSAKGKKEALTEKLIKAVKDGLISLDDDDEEAESEDEPASSAEESNTTKADTESEDGEEDDDTNNPENPNMTKERKTALVAFENATKASIKSGEITVADMKEFLAEFHEMEVKDLDEYSDEDISDFYIDAAMRFIADNGEIVEEEAYMLNGEPACCGHALTYNEDTEKYHCEVCGNDYDAE